MALKPSHAHSLVTDVRVADDQNASGLDYPRHLLKSSEGNRTHLASTGLLNTMRFARKTLPQWASKPSVVRFKQARKSVDQVKIDVSINKNHRFSKNSADSSIESPYLP